MSSSVRLHNTLHPKTLHPKHRRPHVRATPVRDLNRRVKVMLWAFVCIAFAITLANIA